MRPLLAFLLLLPNLCLAQVPDYVPSEGLVLFMNLDGNAQDQSGSGNHGVANGLEYSKDRFGNTGMAAEFGINRWIEIQHSASINFASGDSLTWSVWMKTQPTTAEYGQVICQKWNGSLNTNYPLSVGCGNQGNELGSSTFCQANQSAGHEVFSPIEPGLWTHGLMTQTPDSVFLYVNGNMVETSSVNQIGCGNTVSLLLGRKFGSIPAYYVGELDDFGLWNRVLSANEIAELYNGSSPSLGCTDSDACNFQMDANADDGSCEYGCLYCGEGTVWDSISSTCVPAVQSGEIAEDCTMMNLQELAQNHLLLVDQLATADSLLAICNGTAAPEINTTWACGDPLTYWDYDYATVLIGDQCWFAENLRAEIYRNGDVIPVVEDDDQWNSSTTGTKRAFQNNVANVQDMGYLYSWNAGNDDRGLCPSGWHVPSKTEFAQIEMALGMSESDAISEGWHGASLNVSERMRSTSWGGSDELGINVVRAPWHSGSWHTGNAANATQFLTSTLWDSANGLNSTSHCWTVVVTDYTQSNYHADSALPGIFSVRCLKD